MLRLGDLELVGGRPNVAVSFTDVDGRGEVAQAREAGVAIAELRIDLFARLTPDYVALQAERLAGLPTIATIRLAAEGGAWTGDEAARLKLYEAVLPFVDGIDVELRTPETIAALAPRLRKAGKLLIVSHHDLEATPAYEALADLCRQAGRAGADIVKIAAIVRSDADAEILARLLDQKPAPHLVVIGMGEKGLATRLAFPTRGSLFTFAAKGDRVSAPGQIPYLRMLEILKELRPDGEAS